MIGGGHGYANRGGDGVDGLLFNVWVRVRARTGVAGTSADAHSRARVRAGRACVGADGAHADGARVDGAHACGRMRARTGRAWTGRMGAGAWRSFVAPRLGSGDSGVRKCVTVANFGHKFAPHLGSGDSGVRK